MTFTTLEEGKAQTLCIPMEGRIIPEGRDEKGRPSAQICAGLGSRTSSRAK